VERIQHVNRIKGLLATQGVFDFEPMHRDRRKVMAKLRCWNGQSLPPRLKAEIARELHRLEMVISQIAGVEAPGDHALPATQKTVAAKPTAGTAVATPRNETGKLLVRLRGIGPEFASVLSLEAFYRSFCNRREVASYAGLAPSPWRSGSIKVEQ